jgi:hypothetical protein
VAVLEVASAHEADVVVKMAKVVVVVVKAVDVVEVVADVVNVQKKIQLKHGYP